MPIVDLPQRAPELGRIRMGEKVETQNGKERPSALDNWRLTSHDELAIRAVASIYGGDPEPWEDAPDGGAQWQVTTETSALSVLLPHDPLGDGPWYERWGKGGCLRRCDGQTTRLLDQERVDGESPTAACWCIAKGLKPADADDIKKGACDLVLRLQVILPDVPGLGVWMFSTGSLYAAMEIPAQVALLRGLADRTGTAFVPAELAIVPHREKKAWEKFPREFPVPTLRVRQSYQQVAALTAGDPAPAAIERESSRPSTVGHFPPHVQQVIYACGEAKLTDDQRHALIHDCTNGRTSSSRELTTAEAAIVLARIATGTDAGAAAEPKPTKKRMAMLMGLLADGGVTDDQRHAHATSLLGRPVTTFSDLTRDEADRLIVWQEADNANRVPDAAPPSDVDDAFDREPLRKAIASMDSATKATFGAWWKEQDFGKLDTLTADECGFAWEHASRLLREAEAAVAVQAASGADDPERPFDDGQAA